VFTRGDAILPVENPVVGYFEQIHLALCLFNSAIQYGVVFALTHQKNGYLAVDRAALERIITHMSEPFFTNAPRDVTFVGGDPVVLRKAKAVELSIGGDLGLADRLNDTLLQRKSGIYGFPVKKEVLQVWDCKLATRS